MQQPAKQRSRAASLGLNTVVFLLSVAFLYVVIEVALLLYYQANKNRIYDDGIYFSGDNHINFHPVFGYRYPGSELEFVRIAGGRIEFYGMAKGNNLGFLDNDDFFAKKNNNFRVLVFGDSFTSGSAALPNWADRVEIAAKDKRFNLELLNFSLEGSGLANWWSVLNSHIIPENYEVDAILFAVFDDDLNRKFVYADYDGKSFYIFNRSSTWSPEDWPVDSRKAFDSMITSDMHVVSRSVIEELKQGDFTTHPGKEHPLFFNWVIGKLKAIDSLNSSRKKNKSAHVINANVHHEFSGLQKRFIMDFSDYAKSKGIPILVAWIPTKKQLEGSAQIPTDISSFSNLLNAELINGADFFQTGVLIDDIFYPHDHHWNHLGTDLFASGMLPYLEVLGKNKSVHQ